MSDYSFQLRTWALTSLIALLVTTTPRRVSATGMVPANLAIICQNAESAFVDIVVSSTTIESSQ